MRPVINLLSYFATLRNQPTTLLVSTTGDTGPAAVHAVNDACNPLLTILVHYPYGQISAFQRKQLTTVHSKFVKVVSFEGGGDDMDWPIKETLLGNRNNDGSSSQHGGGSGSSEGGGGGRLFCGINSYNIGRSLMQMIHFIWIYLRMAEELGLSLGDESKYWRGSACMPYRLLVFVPLYGMMPSSVTLAKISVSRVFTFSSMLLGRKDSPIDMVLPTGAMGNLTGGYMAKQMGIPIGKLCCGVNINGKKMHTEE